MTDDTANNLPIIPRIVVSNEKKLVGKRLTMSFAAYNVGALWKNFMPRRKEITNNLTGGLISMAIYGPTYFSDFNPANEFEKWATVEVTDFGSVPPDMDTFVLPGGLYAVFDYKGLNTDNSVYRYIHGTWLPGSGYVLDNRPHVEILGDKYRNNDPDSEEEIWIPITAK